MQEGWHYELSEPDGELTYNGVVYNEMKGEFSSPESLLDRYTKAAMFPDTCYGFESGGDPEAIVNPTYEDYLAFYKKYYHPSNSFIYLYGDMDMAEKLEWLDREYLGKNTREKRWILRSRSRRPLRSRWSRSIFTLCQKPTTWRTRFTFP